MAKQKSKRAEQTEDLENRVDPVPGTGHDVKRGNQKQNQYKHKK